MKILIVSQYFYPETFRVNTLAKELVNLGHDVTVLTGYPQYPKGEIYPGYGFDIPYEKVWEGVKIERIKMRPRGKNAFGLLMNCYSFVKEGKKWVRKCKEKFDAVYVFEVSPITVGLPAIYYGKKFKTPVFFNVQDLWPENVQVVLGVNNKFVIWVINKIVDKIYKGSDCILCASRGFAENIANRGVPKEKLVYWPQFYVRPDLKDAKKPELYKDDCFNIVFAGNFGDAQGLDNLVEGANVLKDENVKWFLVGDGRAKERLLNKVKEYGIEDKVVFTGRVDEKTAESYIHFADCGYLSFTQNKLFDMTIPAKLQTYLACGTPILSAAGGESNKIVTEAECGITTEKDGQAIADGVKELMNKTKAEREKMVKNAEEYYEQNFTAERLIGELVKMMEEKNV